MLKRRVPRNAYSQSGKRGSVEHNAGLLLKGGCYLVFVRRRKRPAYIAGCRYMMKSGLVAANYREPYEKSGVSSASASEQ